MNNLQLHLKIKKGDIAPCVLLPGDPQRVDIIGKKLKKFKIIQKNREFTIGIGEYKRTSVTICSTGIGGPSTAIAVEELINAGAKVLIRVGTCGGAWRADIPIGSLIIPTASIRDEGTTREYIPEGFPAVADFEVVQALIQSAKNSGQKFNVGINRSHDAFYGNSQAITRWGSYLLEKKWCKSDTPILSSEMESAILFVIASLRNVKAGAILAVNAGPEPLKDRLAGKKETVSTEANSMVTKKIVKKMIIVALNAINMLDKN